MPRLAPPIAAALAAILVAGCAVAAEPRPEPAPGPIASSASPIARAATSTDAPPTPSPAPTPSASPPVGFDRLRVFVTSESTDSVWVLEGGAQFSVVGRIPVGRMPHNIAVSPGGRWIAVGNRLANSVSIIDPLEQRELARVGVGRQPHDLAWHPDGRTLFVGHERDTYIGRIEAGSWKPLAPLVVGLPQHDLAIARTRPSELFFTVTNSGEADHLRVYDLGTGAITRFAVQDVHDVFFTPDASEVWTTSSGFLHVTSDRLVAHDPATKRVKEEFRLPGRYPFHTMKEGRDGAFFPPPGTPMLLSDHTGPSLLFIDPVTRRIIAETAVGPQPFHTTFDPLRQRLLVTSNADGAVRVIDLATRAVVQRIDVPTPHGIVAVGVP